MSGYDYIEDDIAYVSGDHITVTWVPDSNQSLAVGYWAFLIDANGNMRELEIVDRHEVDINVSVLTAGVYTVRIDAWSSFSQDSRPVSSSIRFVKEAPPAEAPEVVEFSDKAIENAVLAALERASGPILREDLDSVTTLNLGKSGIKDLSELQKLTNLKVLYLDRNGINDISALAGMTQLEGIELSGNVLSDISALNNLTNLKTVSLIHNQVSDLSPLSSLSQLKRLYLMSNRIDDISALASLQELREVDIRDNAGLSDLSPLMSLAQLEKYYGPEWPWPTDNDKVILGIFPEDADPALMDAFNSAMSDKARMYTAMPLSREYSAIAWKYLLENSTQAQTVDAICLLPYPDVDYSEAMAKAVQIGKSLHLLTGNTAHDIYTEVCALYGEEAVNNPY